MALVLTIATSAPVLARCDPGRTDGGGLWFYGRRADDATPNNEIKTIEAEIENDGEYGYYPFMPSGAGKSAARVEMWSTRSHMIWYDDAQMLMEIQWGPTQGAISSSIIWIRLTEEETPDKVIVSDTARIGDLDIGDMTTPKLEIHTHSLSGLELPYFEINDHIIYNIGPQLSAPNGFRYSRTASLIRNSGSQVPGDGDVLNFTNAKWERGNEGWEVYPMSSSVASNSWGAISWSSGAMSTHETFC
jgi:hypothetical protein